MRRVRIITRRIAPLILGVVLWWAVAGVVWLARGVEIPTPLDTLLRLLELLAGTPLGEHAIYRHIGDSVLRWLSGFAIATAAGIMLGLAAGWRQTVHDLLAPLIHAIQLIPGLAWIPVALLLFGVGQTATVFMIAMTAFAPIAMNLMDGVRRVDTTYVRAAQMLGARRGALFVRVLLPGALPSLITGLRVGLGNGWRVLVAGEMVVGTGTGLGYSIIEARWTLDYASAFACIAIICTIGLIVERYVFTPLEAQTVKRWALARDPA